MRKKKVQIPINAAKNIYYDTWKPDREGRTHFTWKETPDNIKSYLRIRERFSDDEGNVLLLRFADIYYGPPQTSRVSRSNTVWYKLNNNPWFNTGNNNIEEEINKIKKCNTLKEYSDLYLDNAAVAITGDTVELANKELLDAKEFPLTGRKYIYVDSNMKFYQMCLQCKKIKPYSRKYFRAESGKASEEFPVLRNLCKDCKSTVERGNENKRELSLAQAFNTHGPERKPVYLLCRRKKEELIYLGCYADTGTAKKARKKAVKNSIFKQWSNDEDVVKEKFPILVVLASFKEDKQLIITEK